MQCDCSLRSESALGTTQSLTSKLLLPLLRCRQYPGTPINACHHTQVTLQLYGVACRVAAFISSQVSLHLTATAVSAGVAVGVACGIRCWRQNQASSRSEGEFGHQRASCKAWPAKSEQAAHLPGPTRALDGLSSAFGSFPTAGLRGGLTTGLQL